jgi:hypothetical protein
MENSIRFACVATLFACGAGDGNRTRTVSLARVLIPPCFPVLQRYRRPQLGPSGPYRPGLVARVWPGSERSWPRQVFVETAQRAGTYGSPWMRADDTEVDDPARIGGTPHRQAREDGAVLHHLLETLGGMR